MEKLTRREKERSKSIFQTSLSNELGCRLLFLFYANMCRIDFIYPVVRSYFFSSFSIFNLKKKNMQRYRYQCVDFSFLKLVHTEFRVFDDRILTRALSRQDRRRDTYRVLSLCIISTASSTDVKHRSCIVDVR